jgi:hypothetical protein
MAEHKNLRFEPSPRFERRGEDTGNPTSAVREKIPRKIKVIRSAKSFRHHSFAGVVLTISKRKTAEMQAYCDQTIDDGLS